MNYASPFHVFIVPDGNRRWAKKNGFFPWQGHQRGYIVFKDILEKAWELRITHLTFWALSRENIEKRSKKEIGILFQILKKGVCELKKAVISDPRKICFHATGDFEGYIPDAIARELRALEEHTLMHTGPILTLLIAYDGVWEMCRVMEQIKNRNGDFLTASISPNVIHTMLATSYLPMVDLFIRTGGEPHLSGGALMWQMQNAHLYFTDTLWPDFSSDELECAMEQFRARKQRRGA